MSTVAREVGTNGHAVAAAPITVLLVEDHRVLAESFAAVLKQDPGLALVGIAGTSASAVALVDRLKPDVVVMDIRLPDGSGIEAATAIKANRKDTGIIFLTAYDNDETLWMAMGAGAAAFLPKSEAPDAVVEAIKRVAAGEMMLEPGKIQDAIAWHGARRRYEADRAAML
ncbi:MAG TPA: response regulator transcription factor, partial [Candidatus Dormibacteraeota bacterium]|nr:response regulator transcription factor [Candidatus Dormibacteraeota bacterium]